MSIKKISEKSESNYSAIDSDSTPINEIEKGDERFDAQEFPQDHLLIVETKGAKGLQYRSRLESARTRGWRTCAPYEIESVVDAAGAGDWCSAMLIDQVLRNGKEGFLDISRTSLLSAFEACQATAAWSCGFRGARGGMHEIGLSEFRRQLSLVLDGYSDGPGKHDIVDPRPLSAVNHLCLDCRQA